MKKLTRKEIQFALGQTVLFRGHEAVILEIDHVLRQVTLDTGSGTRTVSVEAIKPI